MNGWVDESMGRRLDGGMNGQMDERVSGWMGGWMDGWMAVGRRANISEPTCKTIRFLKKLREYRPVPMHCIFYFQTSDSKGIGPAFPFVLVHRKCFNLTHSLL